MNENGVATNTVTTTTNNNNNSNDNNINSNVISSNDHDNNNTGTTTTTTPSDLITFHGVLKIKNMCSSKTVKKVIVNLINFVVVRYGRHEMLHKLVVGKTCISACVSP